MMLTVAWDSARKTYLVLDEDGEMLGQSEDGEMLGQSPDHAQAVALAVKDVRTLRLIGVRASVVSKKPNGKLRQEWAGDGGA